MNEPCEWCGYVGPTPCRCRASVSIRGLEARVAELEAELRDVLEEHSCLYADGDGPCAKCARLSELNP